MDALNARLLSLRLIPSGDRCSVKFCGQAPAEGRRHRQLLRRDQVRIPRSSLLHSPPLPTDIPSPSSQEPTYKIRDHGSREAGPHAECCPHWYVVHAPPPPTTSATKTRIQDDRMEILTDAQGKNSPCISPTDTPSPFPSILDPTRASRMPRLLLCDSKSRRD